MSPEELTSFLHHEIPLVKAMQATVAAYDGTTLHVRAPLGPNLNHHDTAFGGSIATLAILAGWSLLHVSLIEAQTPALVIIQRMSLEYLRPVDTDFEAIATKPADLPDFLAAVKRKRKGRQTLQVEIHCAGRVCAKLEAHYVALAE